MAVRLDSTDGGSEAVDLETLKDRPELNGACSALVHRVETANPRAVILESAEDLLKTAGPIKKASKASTYATVALFAESSTNFSRLNLSNPGIQKIISTIGEVEFIKAMGEISEKVGDETLTIARPTQLVLDYFKSGRTMPFDRYLHVSSTKAAAASGFQIPDQVTWSAAEQSVLDGEFKLIPDDSVDALYSFMKDTVPHEYGVDGCDPRCKWSANFMQRTLGLKVGMVKIKDPAGKCFERSGEFPAVQTQWNMHTAAFVETESGEKFVIDYALDRPVPLEEWKSMLYPKHSTTPEAVFMVEGCQHETHGGEEICFDRESRDLCALYLFENLDGNDMKAMQSGWRDRKPVHPELKPLYEELALMKSGDSEAAKKLQLKIRDTIAALGEFEDAVGLVAQAEVVQDPINLDGKVPNVMLSKTRVRIRWVDQDSVIKNRFDPETRCYYMNDSMLELAQSDAGASERVKVAIREQTS